MSKSKASSSGCPLPLPRRIDLGILGTWPSAVSWDVEPRQAAGGGTAGLWFFLFGLKHFYFECLSLKYTPAIYMCVCVCVCVHMLDSDALWQIHAHRHDSGGLPTWWHPSQLQQQPSGVDWGSAVDVVVHVDNACGLSAACCVRVCVRVHLFLLSVCVQQAITTYTSEKREGKGETRPRMLSSCRSALLSELFLLKLRCRFVFVPRTVDTRTHAHTEATRGNCVVLSYSSVLRSFSLSLSFSLSSAVNYCGCQYFIFDWLLLVM